MTTASLNNKDTIIYSIVNTNDEKLLKNKRDGQSEVKSQSYHSVYKPLRPRN